MRCPKCGSENATRNGRNKTDKSIQRWKCQCGKEFDDNTAFMPNARPDVKIAIVDIETTPTSVWVWQLKNNNYIHMGQVQDIKHDWNIICWRAKWLFEDKIFGAVQTPKEARNRDDSRITKKLWNLFDEADILIGHNIVNFDRKKSNSRFLDVIGMPPSPYQMIDTLKIARANFQEQSNKLDYLCKKFVSNAKFDTGFQLWIDCMNGNKKALKHMYDYNGQDVKLTEDLYLLIRAWDKRHPNLALYGEYQNGICHVCGSSDLKHCNKQYITAVSRFDVLRCKECGALNRKRQADKRPPEMLRGVAR